MLRKNPSHLIRALLLTIIISSCGNSSEEAVPDLDFGGLKQVTFSNQSDFILAWEHPENVAPSRYEIFIQQISGSDFTSQSVGADSDESANLNLINSETSPKQAKGVFVNLEDEESPISQGKLLKDIEGSLNSYKISDLNPGNYALSVVVEDELGRKSSANRVYLLSIQELVQFDGLKLISLETDAILLKWDPLKTSIRGKDSFYTVFLGDSFSTPVAIVKETEYRYPIVDVKEGTTLTFAVRATDPRGIQDINTVTQTITTPVDDVPFEGCIKARALGADRVEVHFEWPTHREIDTMVILRSGIEIYRTQKKTETSFLDVGLSEGESYTYSCQAAQGSFLKTGNNEIRVSTLTSNPPTFDGIEKLEVTGTQEVKVYWGVATGVTTDAYQIFANPGTSVDWDQGAIAKTKATASEYTVSDLGDDLTMAFGVRACSAAGICDFNEATLFETTGDAGYPKTKGAIDVRVENGKAIITAPWSATDGGIAERVLYLLEGSKSSKISDYRVVQTLKTTNNWEVPTELTYNNLLENVTYNFIVRDSDPNGKTNTSTAVASVTTGDLTAPTFAGLTQIRNQVTGDAGDPETELLIDFTALAPQTTDPAGVHEYILYQASSGKDACSESDHTEMLRFSSASYPAGAATYVVEGLTSRETYNLCLKASDQAGNISDTTASLELNTLDITAPSFDGIQSISYDKELGKISLTWNEVTTSDMYEFQLKLWKDNPDSTAVYNVTIPVSKDNKTGYQITSDIFEFGSLEQVYTLVQACDDAQNITNGVQNCTTLTDGQAFSITLADIDPPSGFLGVDASTNFTQPSEGTIGVSWIAPSDWTDYAGFKVYSVDSPTNDLTFMKDCFCVSQDCNSNNLTSCLVSGVNPYQNYRFHVKAYDSDGNHTTLDIQEYSTTIRANDATSPSFAVALQLSFDEGQSKLSWGAASDNQYVETAEETYITYKLYRKLASDFNDLSDPGSDSSAVSLYEGAELAHNDSLSLVSGSTYYYAICAEDMSANSTCLASSKSVAVPDLIPPTITSFTSDRADENDKLWTLSWSVSDNDTATSSLVIQVKALFSTGSSAADFSSASTIFVDATGASDTGSAANELLSGEANADKYVHYLLIVTDQSGNKSYANLSHFSKNKMTVTSIAGGESDTSGGNRLVIRGTGFHSSTSVKIDGNSCSNAQIVDRIISCDIPSGSSTGTKDIIFSNEDGSSITSTAGFKYCTPNVDCDNICNNPLSWDSGTDFALTTGRGDTEDQPYILCNKTHLDNIQNHQSQIKYYELHANVDLQNTDPGITQFYGLFDGKGHAVENLLDTEASPNGNLGFFDKITWSSVVKDFGVLNGVVGGYERVGLVIGEAQGSSSHPTLSGLFSTGTARSNLSDFSARHVGGLIGVNYRRLNDSVSYATVTGNYKVGGLVGHQGHGGSNLHWGGALVSGHERIGGVFGSFEVAQDVDVDGVTSADGEVKGTGNYGGGIVGLTTRGAIKNADSSAKITFGVSTGSQHVGGIVGSLHGQATVAGYSDSSDWNFTGSVSNENGFYTGCLIGSMYSAHLTRGYTVGATLTKANQYAGGVAGEMRPYLHNDHSSKASEIHDSSVDCVITEADFHVGGIAGMATSGTIKNSQFTGKISSPGNYGGKDGIGGIVGVQPKAEFPTTLTSNTVDATLIGNRRVGGIIGATFHNNQNNGFVIIDGTTTVKVTIQEYDAALDTFFFGGIIGDGTLQASNVHVDANITCKKYCGGFFGVARQPNQYSSDRDASSVTHSTFTGSITGKDYIGGAAGATWDWGNLEGGINFHDNNISFATITSTLAIAGGFFGSVHGTNTQAFRNEIKNTSITGVSDVGGFVGQMTKTLTEGVLIKNNLVNANVTGTVKTGGFAGTATDGLEYNLTIGNTDKTGGESNHGGFAGVFNNPNNSVPKENYFDSSISTIQSTALGSPLSTSQMQDPSNLSAFDTTVWTLESGSYPQLIQTSQ